MLQLTFCSNYLLHISSVGDLIINNTLCEHSGSWRCQGEEEEGKHSGPVEIPRQSDPGQVQWREGSCRCPQGIRSPSESRTG